MLLPYPPHSSGCYFCWILLCFVFNPLVGFNKFLSAFNIQKRVIHLGIKFLPHHPFLLSYLVMVETSSEIIHIFVS